MVGDQADLFRAVVTRLLESSDDGNNTQEYEDAPEEFDMVGDDKEESEVARKKPMYYVSKAWVQGELLRGVPGWDQVCDICHDHTLLRLVYSNSQPDHAGGCLLSC